MRNVKRLFTRIVFSKGDKKMENVLYPNKRLFNIRELMAYTGLGETKAKGWAREIGAARKIGRRTVYDRAIIDKSIDELARQEA